MSTRTKKARTPAARKPAQRHKPILIVDGRAFITGPGHNKLTLADGPEIKKALICLWDRAHPKSAITPQKTQAR